MTPEQKKILEEVDAKLAKGETTPASAPQAPTPAEASNSGIGALRQYYQGLTANYGDEIVAGISATVSPMVHGDRGTSWDDRYKFYKDFQRKRLKEYADKNPGKAMALHGLGALTTMAVPGGQAAHAARAIPAAAKVVKATSALRPGVKAAATGAGIGALYGSGEGTDAASRLKGAAIGAAVGAGGGALGQKAGEGVRTVAKRMALNKSLRAVKKHSNTGQLKDAGNLAYKRADTLDAPLPKDDLRTLHTKLRSRLLKEGYDRDIKKLQPITDVLAVIGKATKKDAMPKRLGTLHQIARNARNDADENVRRLGGMILDEIDKMAQNASPKFSRELKKANLLWQRYKKSENMDRMLENAMGKASGVENGLRIEARSLLKRIADGKARGYTKQEIAALKQIRDGTFTTNTLRRLGTGSFGIGAERNFLGGSIASGAAAGVGSMFGIHPGASIAGTQVAAGGARKAAEALTRNHWNRAQRIMQQGGNLPVRPISPNTGALATRMGTRFVPAEVPTLPYERIQKKIFR
jgi:hypothetical protein